MGRARAPPPDLKLTQLAAEWQTIDDPANEYVYYRQLPEFTIESTKGVHFNLDGEPTFQTKLTFAVLKKHLRVAYGSTRPRGVDVPARRCMPPRG